MRHFKVKYVHPAHSGLRSFETCRHVLRPTEAALRIEADRHALGVKTIGQKKPESTILDIEEAIQ